ncbi:hypothetical protein A8C56_12395 [Niabella ginsenosidivorans]|uniref:Fibronectin type-III domain-containing protein n=1 Tax=Niabella ginsenosidivorans TaxID=1176587 RepID=A0A1A9I2W8_9BACT|nr:right-handed parallel beta-helix repeat-containing protein [Niabella ginsenosidivorans]ANH81675.1 hypothetical protein A8C56_12395 [Niabella ginsenosidivorans]
MKPIFKLLKLFVGAVFTLLADQSCAVTYYVSVSGSDSAAGTSTSTPWQTLAKVNSQTFANGDKILFKRGDVFFGQLRIKNTGVTVSAYGTGSNPVISGLEKITTTWTVNSGNIWETTFAAGKPAIMNNLIAEDIKLPVSRFPNQSVNHGYLNMESHVGLTQFTDDDLPATPDWTGADVVIRSERWRMVRTTVSSHSGHTITIPSNASIQHLRDGYGYFFVNDIKAIDAEGEWAYKNSTGKVYLYSSTDPNTQNIYFPRIDTLLTVRNSSNVVIKNLDIRYSNKLSVFVSNCPNSLLDSLNIAVAGGDGVNYANCAIGTFSNCTVNDVNNTGVYAATNNSQFLVKNNSITNIGNEAFGKSKTFIGLDIDCPNSEVSDNYVAKTGYCAILCAGLNNLVKHNLVDSACLSLEDNGGIYTNYQNGANSGEIIEENIVLNTIGERLGAPELFSIANGIYVDNLSTGVTVRNNTVAFVNGMGLYANFNNTGNQFYNNTSFSSGVSEMDLHKPNSPPGYIVRENILVTTDTSANHNVFNSDHNEDFTYADMGTFTSNYIINPFNNKTVIASYKANGFKKNNIRYTPYEWEAAAPQINGTVAAPIKYDKLVNRNDVIKFYYNKTTSVQTITLPTGRFIDVKNQAYCGSLILQPFTSVVLFRVDTSICGSLPSCGNPIGMHTDSISGRTAKLKWNVVPGAINYDVRYKAEADTGWKYAHNLQDTTIKLLNLLPETYYQSQVRASCYGVEGAWQNFAVFKSDTSRSDHVFINVAYDNCSPSTAFATVQSDTDNQWTLQNSGGLGTVDRDFMRSSSATENCPVITLVVNNQLDSCGTYDIFFYYTSPASQPWKTQAKLSTQSAYTLYDRTTPGTVLIPDSLGNLDRLYRCKIGTVQHVTGFAVDIDDYNAGSSTSRSMFDGVGYQKVAGIDPLAPDSLEATSISASSIAMKWRDLATDETGYVVERRLGISEFSIVATLAAGVTTYTDTLSTTGEYIYRVYAIRNGCNSAYSNQLAVNNNP